MPNDPGQRSVDFDDEVDNPSVVYIADGVIEGEAYSPTLHDVNLNNTMVHGGRPSTRGAIVKLTELSRGYSAPPNNISKRSQLVAC